MHAEFLSVDILTKSRIEKERFSGNGNILQKPLSPLRCARMRSLGSWMSIGVGDAVTMIRDDEFAPIGLGAQTTKNAASRRKRRFLI
jgi:hypothetical protein